MTKEPDSSFPDLAAAQEALPQTFEAALAELEILAERMSEGDLGLDDSIALYQRGVALARVCQKALEQAEQKVQVLQGQLLEPLNDSDASNQP